MGRSFIVTRPGGALMTFGMELAMMATVPRSPWTHGVIFWWMFGTPLMVIESYSSGAPI